MRSGSRSTGEAPPPQQQQQTKKRARPSEEEQQGLEQQQQQREEAGEVAVRPPDDARRHKRSKGRGREALDYAALVENDALWLRHRWAHTLERLGPTLRSHASPSVRVEVERSLEVLLQRLLRQLGLSSPTQKPQQDAEEGSGASVLLDPAHHERARHVVRHRELAQEEASLTAHVLQLQQSLADIARINLHHRNQLRSLAALAVPTATTDTAASALLDAVQRRMASREEDADAGAASNAGLCELREEIDAAFVRFLNDAKQHGDDTASAAREGKLARLLTTWRRRGTSGHETHLPNQDNNDSEEGNARAKLALAFQS